jgi:hypothetical protein
MSNGRDTYRRQRHILQLSREAERRNVRDSFVDILEFGLREMVNQGWGIRKRTTGRSDYNQDACTKPLED